MFTAFGSWPRPAAIYGSFGGSTTPPACMPGHRPFRGQDPAGTASGPHPGDSPPGAMYGRPAPAAAPRGGDPMTSPPAALGSGQPRNSATVRGEYGACWSGPTGFPGMIGQSHPALADRLPPGLLRRPPGVPLVSTRQPGQIMALDSHRAGRDDNQEPGPFLA